jgi:hypothetical protein
VLVRRAGPINAIAIRALDPSGRKTIPTVMGCG